MDQINTRHSTMISSQTVNGTEVYSPAGDHLGHIDELLIDKQSGKVAYAMMAFGGFLGIGEEQFPLPWAKLRYDTERDGYVTDVTKEQLEGAPDRTDNWRADREWERGYYTYYGLPPYWI
jgi:hypothetical protein